MPISRRALRCVVCVALAFGGGCGGDEGTAGDGGGRQARGIVVGASFFPIAEIVSAVGGDLVTVVQLTPPGQEAHEHEPTASQLRALEDADAVAYLGGGFQPALERMVADLPGRVARIELREGLRMLAAGEDGDGHAHDGGDDDHGDDDPHVWLDPTNMAEMTNRVARMLGELDPANADAFTANAETFVSELATLDADYARALSSCASRVIVTGHRAFAYLAARYDLVQVPIAGISPEEEPSAKALEAIADFARDNGVSTIFYESSQRDDLARTVAGEVGAATAALDSAESPSGDQLDAGSTYVGIMRENLDTLVEALRCAG